MELEVRAQSARALNSSQRTTTLQSQLGQTPPETPYRPNHLRLAPFLRRPPHTCTCTCTCTCICTCICTSICSIHRPPPTVPRPYLTSRTRGRAQVNSTGRCVQPCCALVSKRLSRPVGSPPPPSDSQSVDKAKQVPAQGQFAEVPTSSRFSVRLFPYFPPSTLGIFLVSGQVVGSCRLHSTSSDTLTPSPSPSPARLADQQPASRPKLSQHWGCPSAFGSSLRLVTSRHLNFEEHNSTYLWPLFCPFETTGPLNRAETTLPHGPSVCPCLTDDSLPLPRAPCVGKCRLLHCNPRPTRQQPPSPV